MIRRSRFLSPLQDLLILERHRVSIAMARYMPTPFGITREKLAYADNWSAILGNFRTYADCHSAYQHKLPIYTEFVPVINMLN